MRIDGQEVQDTVRPKRRKMWPLLGIGAFVAAIVVFSFWRRDVQEESPKMLGSVWTAQTEGASRLYFIMEEKRSRRGHFDTDGMYSFNMPYSIFTLHARNSRDGDAPAVCTVARTDGGVADFAKYQVKLHLIEQSEILGPQDSVLWLWNDGLEARNLNTLELVWTSDKLKELNPELGALLPTDRKYYKVLGTLKALTYKGSDARYFQIDPRSGKIQVVNNATLARLSREHTKTADTAFQSLYPDSDSLWSTSVGGLMWGSMIDEATNTWYGMLSSDEQAPSDWKHPRYGFGLSGEVSRSFYRTGFRLERSRILDETHVLLDRASVKKMCDQSFLMGGFLRRPNVDNVWIVTDSADESSAQKSPKAPKVRTARANGKSYLVLHRKAIGDDSPWQVTRLGLDGTVHWTSNTGLADPQHLCDGHGAIVFTGFADHSQPTAKRPDLLVFIDEIKGEVRKLNLITGEMTVGS